VVELDEEVVLLLLVTEEAEEVLGNLLELLGSKLRNFRLRSRLVRLGDELAVVVVVVVPVDVTAD
jgi:hypothetical protein